MRDNSAAKLHLPVPRGDMMTSNVIARGMIGIGMIRMVATAQPYGECELVVVGTDYPEGKSPMSGRSRTAVPVLLL
jgi:hypothetical protein